MIFRAHLKICAREMRSARSGRKKRACSVPNMLREQNILPRAFHKVSSLVSTYVRFTYMNILRTWTYCFNSCVYARRLFQASVYACKAHVRRKTQQTNIDTDVICARKLYYYMAQVTSGKIARFDWLLTWRDFRNDRGRRNEMSDDEWILLFWRARSGRGTLVAVVGILTKLKQAEIHRIRKWKVSSGWIDFRNKKCHTINYLLTSTVRSLR